MKPLKWALRISVNIAGTALKVFDFILIGIYDFTGLTVDGAVRKD